MGETTGIEWTDHTFNPWIGCTRVSPACDNCYAAVSSPARAMVIEWGPGKPRHRTSPANWKQPLAWDRKAAADGVRRKVFCASLADVFDNEVPDPWRWDLFHLIEQTPNLDWLLLTKRIGNAAKMIAGWTNSPEKYMRNVWIGATVVTQEEADRDIPKLLRTPAAKRFLSMEPLLGPVDLGQLQEGLPSNAWLTWLDAIDWVIVGGESGQNARPIHPDWVISLRDQCFVCEVPFLFKQWGEYLPVDVNTATKKGVEFRRVGKKAAGRKLHGVTHDGVPA